MYPFGDSMCVFKLRRLKVFFIFFIFAVLGLACSEGFSLVMLQCTGFSLWWLLLLQSTGSMARGLW